MDTAEAGPAVPSYRLCPRNLSASRGCWWACGGLESWLSGVPTLGDPPARPQMFGGFSSGSGQMGAAMSHLHRGLVWTWDLPSLGPVPEATDYKGTLVDLLQSTRSDIPLAVLGMVLAGLCPRGLCVVVDGSAALGVTPRAHCAFGSLPPSVPRGCGGSLCFCAMDRPRFTEASGLRVRVLSDPWLLGFPSALVALFVETLLMQRRLQDPVRCCLGLCL